ncbi:MAG: segregation and condensation protein A [bacterium]
MSEETEDMTSAVASEAPFDAPVRQEILPETDTDALIVQLESFEGPMDLLLDLARRQKVDLLQISVLTLVEQYLGFVEEAKKRRLELAADYLVMAAWLTFLKSKLLLPKQQIEDEPTADEMAAHLAFQLQRLEAMRLSADKITQLPQKQKDFFTRGMPEGVRIIRKTEWTGELYDLLQAYTTQRVKAVDATIKYEPPRVLQIEEARARLERMLGSIPDWSELSHFAPSDVDAPRRSILASAFNAALEFAKDGRLDIRQSGAFQPLFIRQAQKQAVDRISTSNTYISE